MKILKNKKGHVSVVIKRAILQK